MPTMKIAGIKVQRDAALSWILRVEAAVQNVEIEIAVDNQIVSRWQVSGEAEARGRLLPYETGLIHVLVIKQILNIVVGVAPLEGFGSCHHGSPNLRRSCRLLPGHEQAEKRDIGRGPGRNNVA